jgi:hypothetical protein
VIEESLFVLAWFRKKDDIAILGAGFGLSRATTRETTIRGLGGTSTYTPTTIPGDHRPITYHLQPA